jgi:hypothetical protein
MRALLQLIVELLWPAHSKTPTSTSSGTAADAYLKPLSS